MRRKLSRAVRRLARVERTRHVFLGPDGRDVAVELVIGQAGALADLDRKIWSVRPAGALSCGVRVVVGGGCHDVA